MHLEVHCKGTGKPIRLGLKAQSREGLADPFWIKSPHNGVLYQYAPADVYAVADSNALPGLTALGAAIGGVAALTGVGAVVGGIIGLVAGFAGRRLDEERAGRFNRKKPSG